MDYKIKIDGGDGTINLETEIHKVKFSLDTVDKSSLDHSDYIANKLEMSGSITDSTREATLQIAKWAQEKKRDKVYRTVTVYIDTAEERVRSYRCENMFCLSYFESFDDITESNNNGEWNLLLVQKKDGANTEIKCE